MSFNNVVFCSWTRGSHQQSSAFWYLTYCCLHLYMLTPSQETLSLHQVCCQPKCRVPTSPKGLLQPIHPCALGQEGDQGSSVTQFTCFFGVCMLLALTFPHQTPTKECPFTIPHLEKVLELRLRKCGPDFPRPAKSSDNQERQSSRRLHANVIARRFNGFKWVQLFQSSFHKHLSAAECLGIHGEFDVSQTSFVSLFMQGFRHFGC